MGRSRGEDGDEWDTELFFAFNRSVAGAEAEAVVGLLREGDHDRFFKYFFPIRCKKGRKDLAAQLVDPAYDGDFFHDPVNDFNKTVDEKPTAENAEKENDHADQDQRKNSRDEKSELGWYAERELFFEDR